MRQWCNLLVTLFNLYIEKALKDLRYDHSVGIQTNGMPVYRCCVFQTITDTEKKMYRYKYNRRQFWTWKRK